LVELLRAAGLPAEIAADVEIAIWRKVVISSSMNAIAGLVDGTLGEVWSSPEARALLKQLVAEAPAVANAEGVVVDVANMQGQVERLCSGTGDTLPSMAQDLRAGRPTEIGAQSGEVVRRGESRGVPTPADAAVLLAIRRLERRLSASG
jgi:2-dehydropantoate 2-reductase